MIGTIDTNHSSLLSANIAYATAFNGKNEKEIQVVSSYLVFLFVRMMK